VQRRPGDSAPSHILRFKCVARASRRLEIRPTGVKSDLKVGVGGRWTRRRGPPCSWGFPERR